MRLTYGLVLACAMILGDASHGRGQAAARPPGSASFRAEEQVVERGKLMLGAFISTRPPRWWFGGAGTKVHPYRLDVPLKWSVTLQIRVIQEVRRTVKTAPAPVLR